MRADLIVAQLQQTIPRYTNLFSDTLAISSLTYSAGTVTAVTASAHGLNTNDYVYINGALTPITITDITRVGTQATATTASNHDLTDNYQETVTISGADQAGYNGTHNFIHQPNRRTFIFEVANTVVTPATGSPKLLQNIAAGYNGYHKITRVDDTTFTYQITSTPESPAQGTIALSKSLRISAAVSIQRFMESYTKQGYNQLWMCVVLGNVTTSKDRLTLTDRTVFYSPMADVRITIIEPFSLYIVIPTVSEISARAARDLMSDLFPIITKSIGGKYIPSGFSDTTQYGLIMTGHSYVEYSYAYYVHEFNFEYSYEITSRDLVATDSSVAFRDIELQFMNSFDEMIRDVKIDLDDEPL